MLFKKLRKFLLGITLSPKYDKTTVFNSEYLSPKLSTQIGHMYSNAFWKGPKYIYIAFHSDATLQVDASHYKKVSYMVPNLKS